jgi:hypothetical protein
LSPNPVEVALQADPNRQKSPLSTRLRFTLLIGRRQIRRRASLQR